MIGKPVHPNKHAAIFELCEQYLANENNNQNEDWIIISREGRNIGIKNKHTFETFICQKNYVDL